MPEIFIPTFYFLGFFLLVIFIGARVAMPLLKSRPAPSHLLLGATLGIAVYSFFMTVVGFSGGLKYGIALTLAIFHIILFWKLIYIWRWTKFKVLKIDWSSWIPTDLPTRILFWLLIVFQLVMLINSTAPHVNNDTEVSHYLFLKNYNESGSISTLDYNAFSYYPQAIEMAVSMPFKLAGEYGPEAANMCLWLMQLLLMGWLIDFCARRGKVRVGYLLAAAVSGIFYWPVIAYSGYIDGAVTLFCIAGIFTYFDWLTRRGKQIEVTPPPKNIVLKYFHQWQQAGFTQLIVSGIFLGTAAASKYSALPLIVMVSLHLIWILIKDNTTRGRTFASFLGFGIFLLIPMLPWYARNIIETGNPVFPFMRSIFGGPELTLADDVNTWSTWGDISVSLKNYIIYPIKLAFFYKMGAPFDFIRVPYTYMSWLFALVPLAGILLLHRRLERIAAIWCFIFFTFVFFMMNSQTRYFMPFTILGLWLVVEWFETLASNKPASELSADIKSKTKPAWIGWIVFVIVLVPFLTQIDLARNHFIERAPYICGTMSRAEYERSVWPSTVVFEKANELSEEDAKICIFSLRTYRLDGNFLLPPEDAFNAYWFETNENLRNKDIKYLLIETRIRMASALLTHLLEYDQDDGVVTRGEGLIFRAVQQCGLNREITRELLQTMGGERDDSRRYPDWTIDMKRFQNPSARRLMNYLAAVHYMEARGVLKIIHQTGTWELYEIVESSESLADNGIEFTPHE